MGELFATRIARLWPARRPARPAWLPGAGDGTGITGHDAGLQFADIDSKLQGIGAHHTDNLAVAQPLFDLTPEIGEIAAAVARNELRLAGFLAIKLVPQILRQNLHLKTAGCEDDRLDAVLDEQGRGLSARRQG